MAKYWIVILLVPVVAVMLVATGSAQEESDIDVPEVEYIWDLTKYATVSRLWEESERFWHEGDYDSSIRTLRQIIDLDWTQTEAYEDAAWLLDSSDRIFEGFDLLVQNMLANPRNCDTYFELGLKYFYMGGYTEAVQKLEISQRYNCSSLTERMLAHAYERAGQRDKALECFACLVARDQNDGASLQNLLRVLQHIPPTHDPAGLWHRPEVKPEED
jgi:tetratricopeptide (TPR) repeat protein